MSRARLLNVAFLLAAVLLSSSLGHTLNTDPVRKVISMLLTMKVAVQEEEATQEKLYDQFMCECRESLGTLGSSVSALSTKVPQLQSGIKEGNAEEDSLKGDIASATKDQTEAKETLADAKELREKEALAHEKWKEEIAANIQTIGDAVAKLQEGAEGIGFLQTSTAQKIRKLMASMDLSDPDRDVLSAFFQQDQSDSNSEHLDSPSYSEIIGILKQMADTMTKELAESEENEKHAVEDYADLQKAKDSQVEALGSEISTKESRLTEVGMSNVEAEQDLEQTDKSLEEAKLSMTNKKKACADRTASYAELRKTQKEELRAIADAVEILNSDSTSALFKSLFPVPMFLQVEETGPEAREAALQALQKGKGGDPRMDFLALSIRSKKNSFDQVVDMIDKMRALLVKEQQDDTLKRDNCKLEIQKTTTELQEIKVEKDETTKELQVDVEKKMDVEKEIKELVQRIEELDKQVSEAQDARKMEHQEYIVVLADKGSAKDILGAAKKRLEQFYLKFLQAGRHTLRHAQARPVVASLFEGPVSFTQVSKHNVRAASVKDPPAVLTMIDTLMADLQKDLQEAQIEEDTAQRDYTIFVEDTSKQRATDAKTLAEKEGLKAGLEAKLHKNTQFLKSRIKTNKAKLQYLEDKHTECDFLLDNYEKRRDARDSESDALQRAKAVLSGADAGVPSFLQESSQQRV